ncbi:MAG: TonB-dependent siderophore receptor [Pseudomonadota bacterium]
MNAVVVARLVTIPLLAWSTLALSQNDKVDESSTAIEEVLVTGQRGYYDTNATSAARLDLPILETPQSLFIINADLIADQQAFRFDQILQNDSSVQKANNFLGAYSSYSIRGFGLSNSSNFFRDGRTFFHLASVPIEVLERVEVLKGPSSVLYGTMAPGGLINMIPKRPTDERRTSIKATTGSFDFNHITFDHGGKLIDDGSVRYRVNGAYEDSHSFREFADGSDFETERRILSVALDWDLSANTTVRFNTDYTEDNRPQDIGLVSLDGNLSALDYDTILSQPWTQYNSDVFNIFAEINHRFNDNWRLRAGVSDQDYQRDRYDNQTRGVPDEAGNINLRARRRINRWDFTTTYLDIIGKFQTGAIAHQILIGIDRTDVGIDNNETTRNETFATNIFDPVIVPNPLITPRPEKNLGSEDRRGITFQDSISLGEQWRVLVGGRYDEFESTFSVAGVPLGGRPEATNFTPRLGVVYLPSPDFSLYTSYSESFEPNGPVGSGFENAGESLDPTVGEQFEIGAKLEAYEGKLLATGAIFTIERSDAPFEDPATNRLLQRGTQQHDGAELTIAGLLTEQITVSGSATYLDAEFTKDDNPDLVGNTPFGVPEFSLSLTAEYEFAPDTTLRGLSIQGGVFYESDRPVDDANSYDLDSYTRVDVGLKYLMTRFSGTDFIFRLNALNLTDTEYFKARSPFSVNPEAPREIRASVEVVF